MRSSKSRSRSKSNRNRSVGNIVNRVFDSSGPEGKVRGTPQQIIDKYTQLARDAQLGNDRVATENFQQHAEHYSRLLGEAQREADAKREQQEAQNRDRQRDRDSSRDGAGGGNDPQPATSGGRSAEPVFASDAPQPEVNSPPESSGAALDVVDTTGESTDSGLVETPEEAQPKPRARRARKPKPKPESDAAAGEPGTTADASEEAKASEPKASESEAGEAGEPAGDPAASPKPARRSTRKKTPPASEAGSEPKEAAE